MTPQERRKPEILKASRKRRIAAGAGVPVQEVNRLLSQFEQTQKMMKMFSKGGGMAKMMRGMKGMLPGHALEGMFLSEGSVSGIYSPAFRHFWAESTWL